MENPELKKHFINICIVLFIWVGGGIVILSCMSATANADWSLGEPPEWDWYLGYGMASFACFGLAGAGIFFSIVSITMGAKKPELIKVFGIIIFVCFMVGMAIMAVGAAFLGNSIVEVVNCSQNSPYPEWRANCRVDIGLNITIVVCMVAMAVMSVFGIISCVKIVTIMNAASPRGGFVSTQPASAPPASTSPAAASGTQGKFCAACGAPNAADAKFCKGCGKPC